MASSEQQPLVLPVVLGSVRPRRRSERPTRLIQERVAAAGHRTELVDLRALDLPVYGQDPASEELPSVLSLRQSLEAADGVLWLTPEYNHGYSTASKNAIDYLHSELRRKPVAVCGLSGTEIGGARAVEQFKLVLIELHALPIRDSVYFAHARELYDEQGQLTRPEYVQRIDEVIAELAWYAQVLRWGRANLPAPVRERG